VDSAILQNFGELGLLGSWPARTLGLSVLRGLLLFVATVLAGLLFQQLVIYSALLRLLARVSPLEFFKRIRTVMATAFATSSSNATLPTALRAAEERLHLPREVNTVGATANQNGTALYEGVTVLFLAQLFGVDLTLGQQLMLLVFAILADVGTAGVPSGSIPFIVLILQEHLRAARGDRGDPRGGPAPRHVPHRPQRHRGPRPGHGGRAQR
jgi:DAACS family dicarboxylate/amino acid:cation (Na+ or H+) symporter